MTNLRYGGMQSRTFYSSVVKGVITWIFSSIHRFSIGFKSGLWLDHCKKLLFCLLLLLCVLGRCYAEMSTGAQGQVSLQTWDFWSISHLFMEPFTVIWFPGPPAEKHPSKHQLNLTTMFDSGDGVLRVKCFFLFWRLHHCGQEIKSLLQLDLTELSFVLAMTVLKPTVESFCFSCIELIKTAFPNESG